MLRLAASSRVMSSWEPEVPLQQRGEAVSAGTGKPRPLGFAGAAATTGISPSAAAAAANAGAAAAAAWAAAAAIRRAARAAPARRWRTAPPAPRWRAGAASTTRRPRAARRSGARLGAESGSCRPADPSGGRTTCARMGPTRPRIGRSRSSLNSPISSPSTIRRQEQRAGLHRPVPVLQECAEFPSGELRDVRAWPSSVGRAW